jgi:hypothetical protein
MDVVARLTVFRNVCERQWRTPAEVSQTQSGLPYLKVGQNDRVHVVLFPTKHEVALYFKLPYHTNQTYRVYPMDRANGGKWMSDEFINEITLAAAAINHALDNLSSVS